MTAHINMRRISITGTRSDNDLTLESSSGEEAFADATRSGPAEASSKSPETSKKQTRRRLKITKILPVDILQASFGFESAEWGSSAEPSSKEHERQIRRSSSTNESSSSEVPKRPSRSFDEDLFSSKDLSTAFPPPETAPTSPFIGVTRVETSKVSFDDLFAPQTTDSTMEKNHNTKPDSKSTGRRGGRARSSSRGRRKRPSDIEEKSDDEVHSNEDRPNNHGARSSSRGGRRRDSVKDPPSGENSADQGRHSSSSGKRRASSKDPGKRHAIEDNSKENPVRVRSNSRGRRRTSLASNEDSANEDTALSSDPTQTSRLRSTSLDVIRRSKLVKSLSKTFSSKSSAIDKSTTNDDEGSVKSSSSHAMPESSAPRRGPDLKQLVKSFSAKFSSKNLSIDSDDGSVNASSSNSKVQGKKEEKKGVRKMMKKDKKNDDQPGSKPRGGSVGALLKSFSNLKFESDVDWDAISETKEPFTAPAKERAVGEDVWVEPSGDSKRKKDKHDSSRTRSKKDTKKQQDMFGVSTTTGADSLRAKKASKKSKGAVRRSSTSSSRNVAITGDDDASRTIQPASSRKIKFISRKSIANDTPDNDDSSCENAAATLATARSPRSTSSKTSGSDRQRRISVA